MWNQIEKEDGKEKIKCRITFFGFISKEKTSATK